MNQDIRPIIETVEEYAKRRFLYRNEIGLLLGASENHGMRPEFEDLAFIGKFIRNAHSILTRDKLDPSVTSRLADEMRSNLEKSIGLITLLAGKLPAEERDLISGRFLNLTKDSLENLLGLMTELSWFKNYSLDSAGD